MTSDTQKVKCDACEWTGTDDQCISMSECRHLFERLVPGDLFPYGTCPECGCFCHKAEEEIDVTERCDRAEKAFDKMSGASYFGFSFHCVLMENMDALKSIERLIRCLEDAGVKGMGD